MRLSVGLGLVAPQDLNTVGIKGDMRGYLAHVRLRPLVGPDRVVIVMVGVADGKVIGLALVGTGRDAIGALEEVHVNVLARNIRDRFVASLGEGERARRIADRAPAPDDADTLGDRLDRDRMVFGARLRHDRLHRFRRRSRRTGGPARESSYV